MRSVNFCLVFRSSIHTGLSLKQLWAAPSKNACLGIKSSLPDPDSLTASWASLLPWYIPRWPHPRWPCGTAGVAHSPSGRPGQPCAAVSVHSERKISHRTLILVFMPCAAVSVHSERKISHRTLISFFKESKPVLCAQSTPKGVSPVAPLFSTAASPSTFIFNGSKP